MFKSLSLKALGTSASQSELIELALSFGFRGIDLDLVEFAADVQTNGMPKARRLLDSAKLRLARFELPVVWDASDERYQQDLAALDQRLAAAVEIDCRRAWTTIAPASETRPFHQNFEFHRGRLTELADKLSAHDIRLGVTFSALAAERADKPFQFVHDFVQTQLLLGMLGGKVGYMLDVFQIWACGGSLETIQKLSPEQIVGVLLSDGPADVAPSEWAAEQRGLPGDGGAIDATAVLAALSEMGYTGPVIPSPHPSRVAGLRRDALVKQAGEALDAVWKAAGIKPASKLVGARR